MATVHVMRMRNWRPGNGEGLPHLSKRLREQKSRADLTLFQLDLKLFDPIRQNLVLF